MRYLFFIVGTMCIGGALFLTFFGVTPVLDTAASPTSNTSQNAALPFAFTPHSFNLFEAVIAQVRGVTSFAAQAIGAASAFDLSEFKDGSPNAQTGVIVLDSASNLSFPALESFEGGTLVMNIPLSVDGPLRVSGDTALSSTTINSELLVLGTADVASLISQGSVRGNTAAFGSLTVSGQLAARSASFTGPGSFLGLLTASDGIDTQGADINLGEGKLFASNVVNQVLAGENVRITGSRTSPRVSVALDFDYVESINGKDGDVRLQEGSDISITGLTIANTATLASVRSRGGCTDCVVDTDVADALTLLNGTVNGTPIGLSSAAAAAFTDVLIGSTTATATLSVHGDIVVTSGCVSVNGICLGGVDRLVDLSDVSVAGLNYGDLLQFDGADWVNVSTSSLGIIDRLSDLSDVSISSTTAGDFLQFDGTRWVNVSTSSLGLADTFLELSDTPSAYVANALVFSTAAADALTQSPLLVFDGSRLGVGTSTLFTTLTVDGSGSILNQGALRFYDSNNSAYVGFRASTTLSGDVLWTLPESDGGVDQVLVTDGSGNLRFADVSAVGGGASTFLGLTDTPNAYVSNAIPYASSTLSELLFASKFVFDGTNLGIGTSIPSEELTVQGSVRFEADVATPGFVYDALANEIGIGTDAPDSLLTVEGGTILQRGGSSGNTYSPQQVGSLDLPDNGTDVKIVGQYAYVTNASGGNEFRIIDAANGSVPTVVGTVNLPASANGVAVSGKYAYVVTDISVSEFHVIDIANPGSPHSVATVNLPSTAFDVFIQGRYAYVVTDGTGTDLHIIDIGNPLEPKEVGSLELSNGANAVHVAGSYAYLALNSSLNEFQVVDVRNPSAPVALGSANLPGTANDVYVEANRAYVVTASAGSNFHVINISSPSSPTVISSLGLSSTAYSIRVSGEYAYVTTSGTSDNFGIINISNGSAPVFVGGRSLGSGTALGVDISGTRAYVVTTSIGDDFHIIDILGINTQALFAHSLSAGSLALNGDAFIEGTAFITNGLRVGLNGIQTSGAVFSQGTSTSFFLGNVGIGTTTSSNKLSLYSASADAAIELGVAANRFTIGVDQSDTSKFKISSSSVLGTNDRLVIDGAGRVGIGTSTPNQKLVVAGTIQSSDLLGGATNLTTDVQGNIIRDPSDRRLKTDIHTIDGALEKILGLRGVSYRWIDVDRFGDQTEIGFIAQEVDEVLPEVVRKGGDYWSLNTRNILAVVIEAFKEMWTAVEGNTERIRMLEARVGELEAEANIGSEEPEVDTKDGTSTPAEETVPLHTPVGDVPAGATSTPGEFNDETGDGEDTQTGSGETIGEILEPLL